tara:strand:+ start:1146 stop:1538 length:393 start_codon:yes stop_codon:yes gene_type:complete
MGLYKTHKRLTKEISVNGEKFTLTEPSALSMCEYFEFQEEEYAKIDSDASNVVKGGAYTKVNLKLVAMCLFKHFNPDPETITETVSNIYRMLCDEVTSMEDANLFSQAAEEVSGLKFEQTELQDESLETD